MLRLEADEDWNSEQKYSFRVTGSLRDTNSALISAQRRAQWEQTDLLLLPTAKATCLQNLPDRNRKPRSTAAMLLSSWPDAWRTSAYVNDSSFIQSNRGCAKHGLRIWPMSQGGRACEYVHLRDATCLLLYILHAASLSTRNINMLKLQHYNQLRYFTEIINRLYMVYITATNQDNPKLFSLWANIVMPLSF